MAKKKATTTALDPNLTLLQLSSQYLLHMEEEGKSAGTQFSYSMELKLARDELGADTLVSALTADDIERFNKSKRVMKLKNGKPKAEPSFMKTRRVLRLALAWAAQSGLIASSPIAAKNEPEQAEAVAPAPEPKRTRKSRGVVHERAQTEAPAVEAPATETTAA
jgi:hypothetical protein